MLNVIQSVVNKEFLPVSTFDALRVSYLCKVGFFVDTLKH